MDTRPIVLSVAGSDPSGGAGIQQDIKTVAAQRCYGAAVITALTVQNTCGVYDVVPVAGRTIAAQLRAVLDDLDVAAVKIGQVPTVAAARAIERVLKPWANSGLKIVLDPVMLSTSGAVLMDFDTRVEVEHRLFPLCTLVTPNIPETEELTLRTIANDDDLLACGHRLVAEHGVSFLVKGGHDTRSGECVDRLFLDNGEVREYRAAHIAAHNLHGTGCTLSSAIACGLARGLTLPAAVRGAKSVVTAAIDRATRVQIGHGNGPLIF